VSTLVVLIAGFYTYISSGMYDVSQLSPHNALTKSMIRLTKHSSIERRMEEITLPANFKDTALIISGFKHYHKMCASCHAAPGVNPDEMAEGLYPKPPKLFKHAREDEALEFFWIIKNGIKMTSMPAYKPTHSDDEIWAMTAFITQKLLKMSAEEYKDWSVKYGEEGKRKE
jgi:mono/diheme cytochrome c family protein